MMRTDERSCAGRTRWGCSGRSWAHNCRRSAMSHATSLTARPGAVAGAGADAGNVADAGEVGAVADERVAREGEDAERAVLHGEDDVAEQPAHVAPGRVGRRPVRAQLP